MLDVAYPMDLTTMLFVNSLTSFAAALLFLGFWRVTSYLKRPDSLLFWSAAYGLLTLGFALLASNMFGFELPRVQLIANLTIDAGTALSLIATNRFLGRPAHENWPIGFAMVVAVGEIAYALSRPVPDYGVILMLGAMLRCALTVATGEALWRHAAMPYRPPAKLAATFHFAWSMMLAVRCIPVLVETGWSTMRCCPPHRIQRRDFRARRNTR